MTAAPTTMTMPTTLGRLLLLLLLAATAAAAGAPPRVVEMGLSRRADMGAVASAASPGLPLRLRRRAPLLQTLANNLTGGGYYASVAVGSPAQPMTLVIDTGSSDVWVVASDADLCRSAVLQSINDDSCGETCEPAPLSLSPLGTCYMGSLAPLG